MMNDVLRTHPAVFAVHDTYQIMVPVKHETLMWVRVGDECYYDDSNGILKSNVTVHRMIVPMAELDTAQKYTVCYRKIIERKPYFSETTEVFEVEYSFSPVCGDKILAYHISDAHNQIKAPFGCAKLFEKKYGKLDFLILNGDVIDHSGDIKNFDNIYEISSDITGGNIPIVFSRGNHDTRGIYAEKIADYTPTENGNSFFSFRIGNIWGVVIDCGEDKLDTSAEYGNTICCHAFRKRVTKYLENIIKNSDIEYADNDITHKLVVVHHPFTHKLNPPFDIEQDTYKYWAKLLCESIKPHVMICGHTHKLEVHMPGSEFDDFGQACPVVIGSLTDYKDYFAGAGYIFNNDKIEIVFNDNKQIIDTYTI